MSTTEHSQHGMQYGDSCVAAALDCITLLLWQRQTSKAAQQAHYGSPAVLLVRAKRGRLLKASTAEPCGEGAIRVYAYVSVSAITYAALSSLCMLAHWCLQGPLVLLALLGKR